MHIDSNSTTRKKYNQLPMNRPLRSCIFILFIFSACSGFEKKDLYDTLSSQPVPSSMLVNQRTIDPDSTGINFLKWYCDNEERLRQFYVVKGGLPDSTTNYYIDFITVERYIAELRASGFLSDAYLNDLMDYFKQCNLYLKKHPQNDGPPSGFEADLIMKSQDYADVWSNIDHPKIISKTILQNKAVLDLQFAKYYNIKYFLSRNRNEWLIDSIYSSFKTDLIKFNFY